MIHPRKILLVCALAVLGGPLLPAEPAAQLRIGDPAPSLATATAISGKPPATFRDGKLHVVEFWATWCGPCRESIPRLTELARRYKGRAGIIGVDIWESGKGVDPAGLAKARAFVKEQGARMAYTVLADGPEGRIAGAWMVPAGENGIPCSFLVDRAGRVAWIGHPEKLEEVLKQELAGTYDRKAESARREMELEITRPIEAALAARRYPEAVTVIEAAIARRPQWKYSLGYKYVLALFHADPARAIAESRKILDESGNEPGAYNLVMAVLATEQGLDSSAYGFGKVLAAEVEKRGAGSYLFLAMAAEINWNAGDIPVSVTLGEKALAGAAADPQVKPAMLELIRTNLATHKAALQGDSSKSK